MKVILYWLVCLISCLIIADTTQFANAEEFADFSRKIRDESSDAIRFIVIFQVICGSLINRCNEFGYICQVKIVFLCQKRPKHTCEKSNWDCDSGFVRDDKSYDCIRDKTKPERPIPKPCHPGTYYNQVRLIRRCTYLYVFVTSLYKTCNSFKLTLETCNKTWDKTCKSINLQWL